MGRRRRFLLFRVADVIKPFPANRLEALPGGVGVMADDAMAAVYANLALRAVADADPRRDRVGSMRACIVAVGSEMLTPFRVDTNSLFVTERLNAIGFDVRLKAGRRRRRRRAGRAAAGGARRGPT